MGFGSLFIGYFFLLNLSYYNYTDLLAAAIMAIGLYRLGGVNRPFKLAFFADLLFFLVGAGELVSSAVTLFSPSIDLTAFTVPLGVIRYLTLALFHLLLLLGIRAVAEEVGLQKLSTRALCFSVLPPLIYIASAVLNIPGLFSSVAVRDTAMIAFALLLAGLLVNLILLVMIYRCYAGICMPEDADMPMRPSRFAFINRYREKREEEERARAEERLAAIREKSKRRKKKK